MSIAVRYKMKNLFCIKQTRLKCKYLNTQKNKRKSVANKA